MAKKKQQAPYLSEPAPDFNWAAGDEFLASLEQEKPPAPSGMVRRAVGDTGISLLKGAIGVPEAVVGMADLVSGGQAGKLAEDAGFRPKDAKAYLDTFYSPEQQEANRKVQSADGWLDTLTTAVANPSTIVQSAVESAPSMLGGAAIARGALAVAPRLGVAAAGIGEGAVSAGQNAEQVRQETADGLLTGRQAAIIAGSGALTGAIGAIAGKVAAKLGIADPDTFYAGVAHASPTVQKGIVRKILEGVVTEGVLEELPQSLQEQVAQNLALGKPLDEGVANAAVMGMLAGGLMGGAHAPLHGREKPPPTEDLTPRPGDAVRDLKVPEVGPLTRAANVGLDVEAHNADTAPPGPPPLAPEQEADLLKHANERAAELAAKEKGDEKAKPQFLTPTEKAEQEFLKENGGDAAKLRDVYPERLGKVDPEVALARMERGAERDAAITANQRAADDEAEAQAARERRRDGIDAGLVAGPTDIMNPKTGAPWKSRLQVVQEQKKRPDTSVAMVEGGYVLRPLTAKAAARATINALPKEEANVGVPMASDRGPAGGGGAGTADAGRGVDADGRQPVEPAGAVPVRDAAAAAPAVDAGLGRDGADAAVAAIAGEKIDNEWTAFAPDSGTKSVPRADMPQIKADHRGALTQFLKGRGIAHEQAEVDPATLKPTQAEFSPEKVAKAREFVGEDRAILVSNDGHVLDGHHQWLAKLEAGAPIRVIRFDAPIETLMAEAKQFPSAEQADGATTTESTPNDSTKDSGAEIPVSESRQEKPEPDEHAAWWTRATSAERLGALSRAGWSVTNGKPSLSAQRLMNQPWAKLNQSQRDRISAALAITPAKPAPSTEAPASAATGKSADEPAQVASAPDDGWVEGNDSPNPKFKTWTKKLPDGRELQVLQTGPRTFNATNASGRPGSGAFGTLEEAKAAAKPSIRTEDLTPENAPAVSANTIFTEDAAAKARAILKAKLGQVQSGIDPELLQAGITLAGYHIERGARTFAAYAKAMLEDMGEAVKPYLKSFYMAVKYDPRASAFDGMSSAAEVEAAEVDATGAGKSPAVETQAPSADTADKEPENAARPLDRPSPSALEGAPAADVPPTGGNGQAGSDAQSSSRSDGAGDAGPAGAGVQRDGGVGDDAGAVPVPAGGTRPGRTDAGKPRVRRGARPQSDAGLFDDAGRAGTLSPGPNAAPVPAPAFKPTDFTITDEFALGEGGQKTKYRANVEAIRLLKQLDAEQRAATPDEQKTLARYVGWGGISQVFDAKHADWTKEHAELKALLTADEWADAAQSTQYAHYTSREVIGGVYDALARLGFTGGRILEPGSGVGNFMGLMPSALKSGSRFTAIEREPIAAGIARHLYPKQNVQLADYTEFRGNDDYFDAAIGNPPFAKTSLTDASGRKHLSGLSVHNYFFAKSVDQLREGGVLAMVVSNYFLDARTDTARKYIAERTRFLGAIRLPNNAFSKNANTEVTTDVVFLQKRPESEWGGKAAREDARRWLDVADMPDALGGEAVPVNRYFAENPHMMLGSLGRYGTMYGPDQPALKARPGQDTAALLRKAIENLPEGVYTPPAVVGTTKLTEATVVALKDPSVQEGGFYVADGKLYQRLPDAAGEGRARELTPATQWTEKTALGELGFERLKALSEIRATLRALLAAELNGDKSMEAERAKLNEQYDAYTKAHGLLNDPTTTRLFDDDPDFPLLASLEHDYTPGLGQAAAKRQGVKPQKSTAKKAPIFRQRVVDQRQQVRKVETPADALAVSMAERGRIDSAYIAQLLGKDAKDVLGELARGDKPLLFLDPATDEYVLRDAYLSGNVRAKLAQARQAGLFDNARALEAVQPEDVSASQISARIGSPWIPERVYEDFARELFGAKTKAVLQYVKINSSYSAAIYPENDTANTSTWGTTKYEGADLLVALLNNRDIKVTWTDSEGKRHVDIEATEQANIKAQDIRNRFADWLFTDGERAEVLVRAYNDTNNNYVTREYDGSFMTFPGKVPDSIIKFRRHQRNAIARIVQDRTALLDHVVGAGKTFTIVAGAMELKRTGLSKKPMIAVPNHLVKQWAADFYRLYPGANILTATKKDFAKANRRKFLARIATGDWDAVVIAHSSFGFIKPAPDFEARFNERQIKTIVDTIEAVEAQEGDERTKKRTVKQLEALKERLETRIKSLRDKPMDALLDFDQIGVDQLFVDEAHLFKNLMFSTKMQNIRGLGDSKGSQRAYDMYVKVAQVYEKNGRGQGVVFATGTPVSNTLAEMYHMMRYLMPQAMEEMGFTSFDAWANTFASVNQEWDQKTSGDGFKAINTMSSFVNTHELLRVFDQVADTVTMDDIKAAFKEENGREFPLPALKTGRRQPVSLVKSEAQNAYMQEIAKRAKILEARRGPPQKGEDNALVLMTDARKAAMDIRLVDPNVTERDKGGRIDSAADAIFQRWQASAAHRGTQLVFSDLGTPIKTVKAELAEYQELKAIVDAGTGEDVTSAALLGDEAAIHKVEASEEAQATLDAKGADWLTAIQAALRGFSVYDDLKAALVERGVPEHEIAFIHDANTDEQKAGLFRKVNSGQIRVLLGSTSKMGAGTNVQERLVALHHLDVPWKPSDIEQREGRILRQGNRLEQEVPGFEVEILAYVTRDTLDMKMWMIQERKLKMINQLRARKIDREIENSFEDMEMSAGEMQAAATGNMDLLREIQLRTDVKKLEQRKRAFEAQRNDLDSRRRRAEQQVAALPKKIEELKPWVAAQDAYAKTAQQERPVSVTINGKTYTTRGEAAEVLRDIVDAHDKRLAERDEKIGADPNLKPADVPMPKLAVEFNGKTYGSKAAVAEAFADAVGDAARFDWTFDGKAFIRRSALTSALSQTVADAIATDTEAPIGEFGPFKVSVEGLTTRFAGKALDVIVDLDGRKVSTDIGVPDDRKGNVAEKLATAAVNMAERLAMRARPEMDYTEHALRQAKKTLDEVNATSMPDTWPDADKLEKARAEHRDVLKRLSGTPEKAAEAPAAAAGEDNEETAFSRTRKRERNPKEHAERIQELADLIASRWANPPEVIVVESLDDPRVPKEVRTDDEGQKAQGAEGVPAGFFHKGKVYLVASQLEGDASLVNVLFHEALGHYGLRGVFGTELGTILDRLAILNQGKVRTKAREYGLDYEVTSERRMAAEEVLAEMAQTDPQIGWVKRAIAAIRSWLREHVPGFKAMAMNDAEIIRSFLEPAREFVRTGRGKPETHATTFSRTAFSLTSTLDTLKSATTAQGAANLAHDLLHSDRTFNWWHRTIGTQYQKAQDDPTHFKPVYDAAQTYLHDINTFANDPAALAPDVVPQLKSWRDVMPRALGGNGRPLRLAAADAKVLSDAVFAGTLDDKRVYDAAELRSRFGMNERQVGLYKQFRDSVDRSLDILVASDVARYLGQDLPPAIKQMVSDGDTGRFRGLVAAFAQQQKTRADEALAEARDARRARLADMFRQHKAQREAIRAGSGLSIEQQLDDEQRSITAEQDKRVAAAEAEAKRWAEFERVTRQKWERIDQLKAEGYAPLTRFGRYTVYVQGPAGEQQFFGLFESQAEANMAARRFRESPEYEQSSVTTGVLSEDAYKQFSGMSPETVELFAEVAGVEKTPIFDEYLRRAKNNRSALKRLIGRKGVPGYSEDTQRVLASFLTSNARAASSNLHLGEIGRLVEDIPKEKGDVKDEAIRLQQYVQNPGEEAQAIRGLLFVQYLGGSVASALVNMTQPLMMTFPFLSQYGGAAKAASRLAAAMKDAMGTPEGELGRALAKAEQEGIVSPQELHQLQAEVTRRLGSMPGVRKLLHVWGSLFALTEQFNRRVSFIAAYRTAQEQGMADPFAFAVDAVDQTQGVYNRGNRPNWARGAMGSTLFTFKQYSISYMEFLKRLPPKQRALALVVLLLAAGAQGLPFGDDLDDIIDTIGQALGYDTNSKAWKTKVLSDALGEGAADFVLHGFSAVPGFPLDVSARLGLSNLIPGTGVLLKSKTDKAGEVFETLGPIGGAARDALQGEFRPLAIRNLAKAIQMYQTGQYRDSKDRKVLDVTGAEAFIKGVGFQPASVARESRSISTKQQQVALARNVESEIAAQWAQGIVDGEADKVLAARERLQQWNADNPGSRIAIKAEQIQKRVRDMRKSRAERFAKTVPREMRGSM